MACWKSGQLLRVNKIRPVNERAFSNHNTYNGYSPPTLSKQLRTYLWHFRTAVLAGMLVYLWYADDISTIESRWRTGSPIAAPLLPHIYNHVAFSLSHTIILVSVKFVTCYFPPLCCQVEFLFLKTSGLFPRYAVLRESVWIILLDALIKWLQVSLLGKISVL